MILASGVGEWCGFHGLVASSAGEGLLLRDTGDRMSPMFGVGAVE
jgi:hypothetical protein